MCESCAKFLRPAVEVPAETVAEKVVKAVKKVSKKK